MIPAIGKTKLFTAFEIKPPGVVRLSSPSPILRGLSESKVFARREQEELSLHPHWVLQWE